MLAKSRRSRSEIAISAPRIKCTPTPGLRLYPSAPSEQVYHKSLAPAGLKRHPHTIARTNLAPYSPFKVTKKAFK